MRLRRNPMPTKAEIEALCERLMRHDQEAATMLRALAEENERLNVALGVHDKETKQ